MVGEGGDDSVQDSNKDDAVDIFRIIEAASGNCDQEDKAFCE
jgi:hypothetical protein